MTQSEFMSDPLAYYFGGHPQLPLPVEWFRQAWDHNELFREELISYLADNVDKSGSVRFPVRVSQFAPYMTREQSVQLYEGLRHRVARGETEWRPEFIEDFPQSAEVIPPLDRPRAISFLTQSLLSAIQHRDLPEIRALVEEFNRWSISLLEARVTAGEILSVASFELCQGASPDQSYSILELVEAEQLHDILAILQRGVLLR